MNQSSFNGLSSRVVTPSAVIASQTLLVIPIFIGFVGIVKVCHFFINIRDLRKIPHFLFVSLSVSGIISYMFCLPSLLVMFNVINLGREDYVKHFQNIIVWSSFLCPVVNSVTLSQMAIDRQHCVLRPFNRRMTPSDVKFIITGKWIGQGILYPVDI